MTLGGYSRDQLTVRKIKEIALGAGFYETCTYIRKQISFGSIYWQRIRHRGAT